MQRSILLTLAAIILVGVVVFLYLGDTVEAPVFTPTPTPTSTPVSEDNPIPLPTVSEIVVTYSDSGYSPPTMTIKKGDMVVFSNQGSRMMWTASDVHPTHKAYPASGIEMCGTDTLVAFFDACGGFGPGESWEFRFDHPGTWSYHNHLQPNHRGTIIVE